MRISRRRPNGSRAYCRPWRNSCRPCRSVRLGGTASG
jgi:hypothetical protein